MRIAWVTPLAQGSGISKYSLGVLPELSKLADVEMWAPVTGEDYPSPDVPTHELRVDDATATALLGYDMVVFNAGNNPSFHTEVHRMSERVPGIVVIHDKRMSGFFHDLWAVIDRDPARYAVMMRHYYGAAGEEAAREILAGRLGVDARAEFPLVEPALWNARGIIVHSEEAARLVDRYGDAVPVQTLGLPFDHTIVDPGTSLPGRRELGVDDGRVLIVSSGGVFEQKRLDSVIQAIASTPSLRDGVRLAVVGGGRPAYLEQLRRLAAESGIADFVHVTGRVDDATLYAWVTAADFAVNLRYPSMESSSLSLVEQLYCGLPVVVTDTSYYSELPETLSIKVSVDKEQTELPDALVALASDEPRRRRMGEAAAEFARTHHDPAVYAQGIMTLIGRITDKESR